MSGSGFICYELLADDVAAAAGFYAAVLGWSARTADCRGPVTSSSPLANATSAAC